jgi:glycerol-3-phosphate dehydrogenase subunit B
VPVRLRLKAAIGTLAAMDDILVIGVGPAGLLAAWIASSRGARVRILATGIGTTHLSPGWIGVLDSEAAAALARNGKPSIASGQDLMPALERWIAEHPNHPYALAGLDALQGGIAALQEAGAQAGLRFVGGLQANFWLPTALGALIPAALAPESFIAGDARQSGEMLIAGPAGWRDFYPALCAGNLARQGIACRSALFDLPEAATGKFDSTSVGLARLFERADVRARVADQLKAKLPDGGATRVGLPAVLGLEKHSEAWHDLQDRLGAPVFEIPTLPPSVPGMRLYHALKHALLASGVRMLLDMTATRGLTEDGRAVGVVVPASAREATFRANRVILATGGLYGGGISSDRYGAMREGIFDLPLVPPEASDEREAGAGLAWFDERFLSGRGHPVHHAGVRINRHMQPVSEAGDVLLEGLQIAGRLVAGYNPAVEGSTEGVALATAYRAASS